MGKRIYQPKETVRIRSGGCCEKCGVELTRNCHGVPDGPTARTIHHRKPQRAGGKDNVVTLVNLCSSCHIGIHRDEKRAEREGWIVTARYPGNVPFLSHRGWILPRADGSLTLLDFDLGQAVDLPRPRGPERVSNRQRARYRNQSRSVRRVA